MIDINLDDSEGGVKLLRSKYFVKTRLISIKADVKLFSQDSQIDRANEPLYSFMSYKGWKGYLVRYLIQVEQKLNPADSDLEQKD